MNILESITSERRADAREAVRRIPVERLKDEAAGRAHHSLAVRLREGTGTRIVAEMKKASPSAGLLRPDYRPEETARLYARHGAAAISVLTEPRHFLGAEEHLREARRAVDLPILRKDFICEAYQVAEAAAWGADVVLLIAAALDNEALRSLYDEALSYGLEVLAEAHTALEIERTLALDEAIIGVNSRDLSTLKTDLNVARGLAASIPADRLSIAESGISRRSDVQDLERLGYRGFLIGEALMASGRPGETLDRLLGTAL